MLASSNRIEQSAGLTVFGNDANGYAEGRPDYLARVYDILRTTCRGDPVDSGVRNWSRHGTSNQKTTRPWLCSNGH
jgi:hypothetical protein